MTRGLLGLLLLCSAAPVFAQDDCPPGHVRNPQVSPLDHDYMVSAFTASFRGLFGRDPTMQPGSGKDDGAYYISASNHYGVYGDDQCHAGWSGYWESWLAVGHGDLALVQTPARFLPSTTPPTPPPSPPPPTPIEPTLSAKIDLLQSIATMRFDQLDTEIAATRQDIADFRDAVRSKWAAVIKSPYFQTITAALVAWATTYKAMHQ